MSTATFYSSQHQRSLDPFARNFSPRSAALTTIGSVEINSYPPGLGYGAWRTSPASISYTSKNLGSQFEFSGNNVVDSPRLAVKRPIARPPAASRRVVPAFSSHSLPSPSKNPSTNPTDSQLAFLSKPNVTVSYHPPSTRPRRGAIYHPQTSLARSQPASLTVITPIYPPAPDKNARSKLVAGILLNRVHAVGKPMRRRPGDCHQPRGYVRSGLSVTIALDSDEEDSD